MTTAGLVTLRVPYVELRESGQWLSPVRRAWELEDGNHPLTPEIEERLCVMATATFSYEKAAQVAACWGSPVADDSTIWHHVQRAGERARETEAARVRAVGIPALREEIVSHAARDNGEDFSLLIMMDGWMARERGKDWGLKPAQTKGERVVWREQKTGIVMRTDHRATTQSNRPIVLEKSVVSHQGEWDGLAKKLHAEALRCGAATAREVFVVADGGIWIWNLAAERFSHATELLDFYHASEHLWTVAKALYGEGAPEAKQWVEPLLHELRHDGEAGVLNTLEELSEMLGELDEDRAGTVERNQRYFHEHRDRLHYAEAERRGCPVGSGAMESTCAQLQGRFKRTGQFWSEPGKDNLMALELTMRNGDAKLLWPMAREQH